MLTVFIKQYGFLIFATLLISFRLLLETYNHKRRLFSIPIRIHINGTRGKSSITRLIAAGLRAGGIETCAKTTGTLPYFIYPDGSEKRIHRMSAADIIEQMKVVKLAAQCKAKALIVECMAVQPHLQSICERKIIRSTHGVISNAWEDHLDVMGPTERDAALALAGTVPYKGKIYTTEVKHLDIFQTAAQDRESTLEHITDSDIDESVLQKFSYTEHGNNIAIALKVCEDLGVDRNIALEGMWKAKPDVGAQTTYRISKNDKEVVFVNGFAANDPHTTTQLWHDQLKKHKESLRTVALINCRDDRRQRSKQLAKVCVSWEPADAYIVVGTGTDEFIRSAVDNGINRMKLIDGAGWTVQETLNSLFVGSVSLVVGMGNIADRGFQILKSVQGWSE